ncbi:zinc finger protein 431-like isoform X2 [Chironomus tepperi]|uniref:zinc finger protein 431-like isoform X2 n=1 Tax=Chironomus tepperi TaxID=113505 RepID=UPI00391FB192
MSNFKKCAVKSCQSRNQKLFQCPKAINQLKKWKSMLEVTQKEFYVCELHFDANFITYEKVLSDEAVPTIFINEKVIANQFCSCCSSPISEGYQMNSFHREICSILFNNPAHNGDLICGFCTDQIAKISDFIRIVEDNRRNFETLDVEMDEPMMQEPLVKIEPPDYEMFDEDEPNELKQNMLFLKTEKSQSDPDDELYVPEVTDSKRKSSIKKYPRTPPEKRGTKVYKCEVCDFGGKNRAQIAEHVKKMHVIDDEFVEVEEINFDDGIERSYECDICREVFNDKKRLKSHFASHFDRDLVLECSECGKCCNGLALLTAHKNCEHKENNRFWCMCYRVFNNVNDMRRCRKNHKLTLESDENICTECDTFVAFPSIRTLATHKTTVHGGGIRFWCQGCGKLHLSEEDCLTCMKNHTLIKNYFVKCPDCDKKIRYSSIRVHRLAVHIGLKDIMCDQCGKGFPTNSQLFSHLKSVHVDKEDKETYECDLCPAKYCSKGGIFTHMNQIHNTEKEVAKCPICLKKIFVALESHMRIFHPNNYDNGARADPITNKFHCPNCIRKFGGLKAFEAHVRGNVCSNFGAYEVDETKKLTIYTEGKFTCSICNNVQTSMTKLRVHMRRTHTGTQTCTICGKVLKNLRNFYKHINKVHKMTVRELRDAYPT